MSLESAVKENTEAIRELIEVLRAGSPAVTAPKTVEGKRPIATVDSGPVPDLVPETLTYEQHIKPIAKVVLLHDRPFMETLKKEFGFEKFAGITDQKIMAAVRGRIEARRVELEKEGKK